ncbi:MAG: hypothetical protein KJS95_07240 [Gammaproteobacteria bacterium]|nr:hypothetical protein [Gammaproteobacteria bacterium]
MLTADGLFLRLALRSALLLVLTVAASPAPAADHGFTPDHFARWVQMRVGGGEPVYWYAVGTVYTYPEGKPVMRMEGIDAARLEKSLSTATEAHQVSRKTFVYRDAETNEILREWQGKPLPPISYPYQYITYSLRDRSVETWVEQGAGARRQRIGPGTDITVRQVGNTLAFSAPLFLDLPMPGGARMQAFEHYDFFDQGAAPGIAHPYQISWLRFGDLPAGLGKGVMHMVSWRVDRYADLPASIRGYLESEARLWLEPPRDIAEIRRLQQ